MASRTLDISSSGLTTSTDSIAVISNNLSNLQTNAFKSGNTSFTELFYQQFVLPARARGSTFNNPLGIQTGFGVQLSSIVTNFASGTPQAGLPFDAFINDGQNNPSPSFFRVVDQNGTVFYTRLGSFQPKAIGSSGVVNLQLPSGPYRLANLENNQLVFFNLPGNPSEPKFTPEGQIVQGGQNVGNPVQLVKFRNPEGLIQKGELLFLPTQVSGPEIVGNAGAQGFGLIVDGSLESSNVDFADQVAQLLQSSRGFNLSAQSFQAGNAEILGTINLARQT